MSQEIINYPFDSELDDDFAARPQTSDPAITYVNGNDLPDEEDEDEDEDDLVLGDERKRLADMRRLVDRQRQTLENLRKKMSDALVGFNSNELSVFTKGGRVYVSLQENLLFPSGSAVVNPKGKEALSKLAQVLHVNPDISVLVEGHTDSVPISTRYKDNWELSVERSTAIVRLLTDTYGIIPERITASGRSKYEPVDTNATPEGRQRNRRTEIILAPKLDELMKLLEQPADATAATQ